MLTVYENIAQCLTLEGARKKQGRHPTEDDLGILSNATGVVEDAVLRWLGPSQDLPTEFRSIPRVSQAGKVWVPALVECHTHLVFGGDRAHDYALRCSGQTYQDIAKKGGGILSTVRATRGSTQEELLSRAKRELEPFIRLGVGCLEIKSGYGLSLESEIRILECVQALQKTTSITLIPTFLPAHAVPPEYQGAEQKYVDEICREWIPEVAKRKLAQFFDVFVETGYFNPAQTRQMARTAADHGLGLKLHVDQFSDLGGTALGVELGAVSCDHLDSVSAQGIHQIAQSDTVAVLAPGASLFTGTPYPPARRLLDEGAIVALTTDFNPGTSPTQNLPLMLTIACSQMKMTLAEAVVAATYNAAQALRQETVFGTLEAGRPFHVCSFDAPSWEHLVYRYGLLG